MVVEINQADFGEKIQTKCVIDFFATWCPPCKMLSPVIEEVSTEMKDLSFYKINVDENINVSDNYRISHVPTIILFENGKELKRISGYIDKSQLEKFINT